MYLQGQLQTIFDALYNMGVIDPVLDMDWSQVLTQRNQETEIYNQVLFVANRFQGDVDQLMEQLEKFDKKALGYLAMEVAREFADYQSRESLH